jgi:ethanolamine utilization protein EutN
MILGRVTGSVVSTQKTGTLRGHKILIVQPVNLEGTPEGRDILALDTVDAGTGDTVLVVQEGEAAAQILRRKDVPVHSLVVAVVDALDLRGSYT